MIEELITLVDKSNSVHVVTHLNPDYDAYANMIFMYALLKKNFPTKKVTMSVETEQPNRIMSYLPFFNDIQYLPIEEFLKMNSPDTLIIVDSASVSRVTKKEQVTRDLLINTHVVIFDHHEIEDKNVALLVNQERYAAVEVIYHYAVDHKLKLPEKWEEYYLTGFIGDSYRFYYQYPCYRESFDTISLILDKGYTIRDFSDRLYGYTQNDFVVYKLLLNHLSFEGTHSFAFITWEEYYNEINEKLTVSEYKKARRFFIDEMMVKTYSVDYAVFLVPDDTFKDGKTYSGSIRSKSGTIDCTAIAKHLGGGGHKTGSGFVVVADSIDEAIKITREALEKYEPEARIMH